MPRKLLDDCFLHDKDRLKHHEVLTILKERLAPVVGTEAVQLEHANGRILAEDIKAEIVLPPRDNAAVDGYAFAHDTYMKQSGSFQVSMRLPAGSPPPAPLANSTAARIFTGAQMPDGADTVAMQEDCEVKGERVVIPQGLKVGANCRLAGEDVKTGDMIAKASTRLKAADLAAISGQGFARISVRAPVKVTLFSTGDELVETGNPLAAGQIYDTNRAMLKAMLAAWPCIVNDGGKLPDDAGSVREALMKAAQSSDVLVTTGGASRGEEDHIVETLSDIGTRHIWQLAIKPGRPLVMGQIGDTIAFGLPGNPVAAFVCALLYLRPALFRLSGGQWPDPSAILLPSLFDIARKKPDRREFYRAFPIIEDGVITAVDKFERDGSGLVSGLQAAKGLVEIPEETTRIARGDLVRYLPLAGFDLTD